MTYKENVRTVGDVDLEWKKKETYPREINYLYETSGRQIMIMIPLSAPSRRGRRGQSRSEET